MKVGQIWSTKTTLVDGEPRWVGVRITEFQDGTTDGYYWAKCKAFYIKPQTLGGEKIDGIHTWWTGNMSPETSDNWKLIEDVP